MAILGATTLTGCSSIPDFIATNTLTIFRGTNAPTGWSKLTDIDNCTLRVVASGALSPGGVNPFTDTFTTRSVGGSIGASSLSVPQIASHTHPRGVSPTAAGRGPGIWSEVFASNNTATGGAGGAESHPHPFGSSGENFSLLYSDVIRCSKTL